MPYCGRYYELRQRWENKVRFALGSDRNGADGPQDALDQLRAHAEVCADCSEALFAAFPETQGKSHIMVDIMDLP